MPRLIIYKEDGEIIHAASVNSSHSPNHLTDDLIERFRLALANGGMKAILVDDHIRAETHLVRHAKESLAIIGKDETRFAFLEPMQNMLRPSAKLFQAEDPAKRIEFVVAPADPKKVKLQPGVTIYVPIVGRWYCLASLLRCLAKMDHVDELPVDLMIHDNSLDTEMERVLRAFLASQTRYRSISYHRDNHEKALALPELAYRTAAVYQRAITVCDTRFLLTVEDDVLPRKDVLPRLYHRMIAHGRGCAAVAAEVAERRECHSMCWIYEDGQMRYVPTGDKLDAVSFSCTLYQTRPLKGLGMVPRWKDGPVATDIALWSRLREEGYHAACEWGCGCPHVDESSAAHPGHPGKLTARKPDTKGDAERLMADVGFPMTIADEGDSPPDLDDLPCTNPHWDFEYLGEPVAVQKADGPAHVSIGMTVHNLPDVTQRCVESLIQTTQGLAVQLVLWDNLSDKDTKQMLASLAAQEPDKIRVITSNENLGYIIPNNMMAREARGTFHIVANNDLIFHPGWFERMRQAFADDPKLALVGGWPTAGGRLDGVMHGGPVPDGEAPDYVEGYFIAMPRHILLRYGGPFDDTHLVFATAEDSDLSLRMKEMGWNILCIPDLGVEHLPHSTRESGLQIREQMAQTEALNLTAMRGRWKTWNGIRDFRRHRILVIREGAKGDLLTLEPVFKGLRWRYPHSHITLKCYKGWIPLMNGCPHFDWIVDMETDIDADIEFDLSNAYELHLDQPKTEYVCKAVGVPVQKPAYWIGEAANRVKDQCQNLAKPLCVVHQHSGWPAREWVPEKWRELIRRLVKTYDVIEVGAESDVALFADDGRPDGLHHPFYGRSYQEVAGLISAASLVIGVDSLILHMGVALGTPGIGLFGPTRGPLVFPWGVKHISAESLDCLGCYHKPPFPKQDVSCERAIECMAAITVQEVLEALP